MAKLGERDVVAARFWNRVHDLAAESPSDLRRITLLFLFLHLLDESDPLHALVNNHIDLGAAQRSPVFGWLRGLTRVDRDQTAGLVRQLGNLVAQSLGGAWSLPNFQSEEKNINRLLEFVHSQVEMSPDRDLLIHVFDYGFFSVFSSRSASFGRIDVARDQYLSALASVLVDDHAELVGDLFGNSGQFAISTSRNLRRRVSCVLWDEARLPTELIMRLRMNGVTIKALDRMPARKYWADQSDWDAELDVILIDSPIKGQQTNRLWDGEWRDGRLTASISVVEDLLIQHKKTFRLALIVIPFGDAVAKGWRQDVRQALVERDQLLAVINLPRTAGGARADFSVLLVRGHQVTRRANKSSTLFVDGDALSHLIAAEETPVAASFLARLVSLISDVVTPLPIKVESRSGELLENIFRREFSKGYRDVPGLCRLVAAEDVLKNNSRLVAKDYLSPDQNETWLHGLDQRELRTVLDVSTSPGRRFYVIGNNGEGKSLLLRDLARESMDAGRRTVAISSGASDRFRFPKKSPAHNFIYLGARTSKNSVDLTQAAVSAGKLMTSIHDSQIRENAFVEVAGIIGFAAEYFLIPVRDGRGPRTDEGVLAGVIRLASKADDDRELLRRLHVEESAGDKYKLGVRRLHESDAITPFDELSSGEQQVIMLAAKIVAHAELGALFLIDEPEISLHVSWQRAIPKVLSTIARAFRSDIIVATHSPVLIASAIEEDDYCFCARDNAILTIPRSDRRSVETVLFEGFQTHTVNNREVHERCASLVAESINFANQEKVPEEAYSALLEKLDYMKRVVDGYKAPREDTSQTDLDLIHQAYAAIGEVMRFSRSANNLDADHEA